MTPPAKRNDPARKAARHDYAKEGVDAAKETERKADEAEKKQQGGESR